MAQPIFDSITIAVSVIVGDEVTTSSGNGNTFSAADRLAAINKARGDIYTKLLKGMGIEEFIKQYPEFVGYEAAVTISPTKDSRIRKVFKMYDAGGTNLIVEAVPQRHYLSAKYDTFSKWYGSAGRPRFIEHDDEVETIGISQVSQTVEYLKQPVDVTQGGSEIGEPISWRQLIIERAVEILLQSQQI
jgi:hypothetical protein